MVDMYTDAYFKVGTLDTAQLVASNNVPVFQYRSGVITRALYDICHMFYTHCDCGAVSTNANDKQYFYVSYS